MFPFPWCFVLLRFCLSHLACCTLCATNSINASDIKDHLGKLFSFLFPAPREQKKSNGNTVHCGDKQRFCTVAMLDGRNNRFFFPWEQMCFLMQIIFIVLPFNMAAVQNLYKASCSSKSAHFYCPHYAMLMSCNKEETVVHSCTRITVHRCMLGFVCKIEDRNLLKTQIDFFMKAADICFYKTNVLREQLWQKAKLTRSHLRICLNSRLLRSSTTR